MAFLKPNNEELFFPPRFSPSSIPATLPGMNTFSNKRRYEETFESSLPLLPLKVPKLLSVTQNDFRIPPPSMPSRHMCTSDDCHYCSGLTNLDIAAFYWSMIAMRGYSKGKANTMEPTTPFNNKIIPSPVSSPVITTPTFDLPYTKPPSPSGSLSSLDSEPLSPSNSMTSETSSMKGDLTGVKYQCQVCHKSYSHPRLLNRHLQSHTPYKKHHCPRCRKGFNDAFDLKRHIRTHTGIKPFHCDLCEKSFTQRCSLEAHMTRVHSVVHKFSFRERRPKLFVCEDCGVTFPDNNKFRQHEKESTCRPSATKV